MAAIMQLDSFDVNVKDFMGRSVVIKVGPTWDVSRIKREIADRTKVSPDDFRVVFAGQTLADTQTLWDIGVQGYSTLHCIRFRGIDVKMVTPLKDVERALVSMTMNSGRVQNTSVSSADENGAPSSHPVHHRFYVYCKRPCGKTAPGKLRVRCADCKDTSFLLSTGPGSWDDVLNSRKMHGRCNKHGCNGQDAEFFFKCASHPTQENEECVALHMIRANMVKVQCAACLEVPDLVVVFNCEQTHCLCLDCFKQYCEVKLTSRQFIEKRETGYTLRCPASCEGSEVTESHHFRMLGKDLYDRYQRFGTEEFILQAGGVLCPNPECGMGLLPEDRGRRVQCPKANGGCGVVFCRICKCSFHDGACRQPSENPIEPGDHTREFQVNPENLERARWITANEEFIGEHTKPCPRCQIPVEKNGGCMHMTCGMASCRYEWCWMCCVAWNGQCQSMHWFG